MVSLVIGQNVRMLQLPHDDGRRVYLLPHKLRHQKSKAIGSTNR